MHAYQVIRSHLASSRLSPPLYHSPVLAQPLIGKVLLIFHFATHLYRGIQVPFASTNLKERLGIFADSGAVSSCIRSRSGLGKGSDKSGSKMRTAPIGGAGKWGRDEGDD